MLLDQQVDNLNEEQLLDQEQAPLLKKKSSLRATTKETSFTSLEGAFRKTGGVGKFHTLMFATFALFLTTGEVYNSLIMYYNKVPDLLCTMKTGEKIQCDWEIACFSDNADIIDIEPNMGEWDTLDNLVSRTHLICQPKSYAGNFGVFLTLGTAFGSLILPQSADVMGRKGVLLFAILLSVVLCVITMFSQNAIVAYVTCFYWGFTVICRYTIVFVWASELYPPSQGSNLTMALRAMIGAPFFLMNAYFMFLSNSISPILYAITAVNIIILAIVFTYPESPPWLLSIGREDEAIESFRRIAQLNSENEPSIKKLESSRNHNVAPVTPRSEVMKEPGIRMNLTLMTILWTGTTFSQYLTSYTLKNLPGDFYTNVYASTTSELIAIILSGAIQNKIGFKHTMLLGYFIAGVSGYAVSFSTNQPELIYALLVLLSRFGICITFNMCYIATQKLFPSVVLASVFGVTNVFARFITVLAPLAAELPQPYPMAIFATISIACGMVASGIDPEKQFRD